MSKIRIEYDDRPNDVMDKVIAKLKYFGIIIKQLDGGDGFEEYEVIRDPGLEDDLHSFDLMMNKMIDDDPELFDDL